MMNAKRKWRSAMPKQKRDEIFIWPSWICKIVAGEEQCYWKYWFKAHYMHDKKPSDFNLTNWTIQHNQQLHQRRDALKRLGFKIFIEDQNAFKMNMIIPLKTGECIPKECAHITISGKADIVAIGEDKDEKITNKMHKIHLVEDIKTGSPKTSDHVQVILYMLWLPLAIPQYKNVKFSGCIVYKQGIPNVDIPPLAAQDASLKQYIWDTIKKFAGDENDCCKVPSVRECSRCDILKIDCSEKIC